MTTFFLLMTLHPEIQQRAQDEIENVVGKCVFPTINDKKNLPYAMALMREMFRFAPVSPLGTNFPPMFVLWFRTLIWYRFGPRCHSR